VENNKYKGDVINVVNKAISDYISPWSNEKNRLCFGWKIKLPDLQHHIKEIPLVKHVTDFSVLHKSSIGTKKYNLYDSAEHKGESKFVKCIQSQIPWSICIPFDHHANEIIDNPVNVEANVTGINKMEIGSIFIVKPKKNESP
jgi:hypothetical protein